MSGSLSDFSGLLWYPPQGCCLLSTPTPQTVSAYVVAWVCIDAPEEEWMREGEATKPSDCQPWPSLLASWVRCLDSADEGWGEGKLVLKESGRRTPHSSRASQF